MTENKRGELAELSNYSGGQLLELLQYLARDEAVAARITEFNRKNLDDFKQKNEKEADLGKFLWLWDETEEIISEFNEYGGGPEEKEETVYRNLGEIAELFKKGKLDDDTRREFVDGCLKQYFYGNSGFDDGLMESVFDVCSTKEDWLYLIGELRKNSRSYNKTLIMEIYKDRLKDDESYLKERMSKLECGYDYYGLAKFYEERGDVEKACEVANEALEKGKDHPCLSEFLLEYYKKKGDYPNSLKFLMELGLGRPSMDRYTEIEKFCKEADWPECSRKLYGAAGEELRAEIDYHNKNYALAFKYLEKIWAPEDFVKWAKRLEPHFPEKLLTIYEERITRHIELKTVGNYRLARDFCCGVKRIMVEIKREPRKWDSYIDSVKAKYPKLPALQRELKDL